MSKPKVLVCALCGSERQNWITDITGLVYTMERLTKQAKGAAR